MSTIILPYEPQYTGHREADDRRRATKEWLRRKEQKLHEEAPTIVPDHEPEQR
jgi:hypothetical protein